MGKRKERRLAALSGAGRRVKLDLFAEPTGELNSSSTQDDVGGGTGTDTKHQAELPSSPSSSDQQQENPLLLLGQYSDDEMEEDSSERVIPDATRNSSAEPNDVVDSREGESLEIKADEDAAGQMVRPEAETSVLSPEALQKLDDNEINTNTNGFGDTGKEPSLTEQVCLSVSSDIQVAGDVSSCWKLVLHEESNRYYYWNTLTGETSWEIPGSLAQGSELTWEQKAASDDIDGIHRAVLGESSSTLDAELNDSVAEHTIRPQVELHNECHGSEISDDIKGAYDVSGSDAKDISNAIDALYNEISELGDSGSPRVPGDVLLGNGSASVPDSRQYTHDKIAHNEDETRTDFNSHLVRHCKHLLERLSSLKGSNSHPQVHEKISKYILEVEIRLSDINSLLPHGSTLLPFWKHSEKQLEQLERAINAEVLELDESTRMTEDKVNSQEITNDDIIADGYERNAIFSTPENVHTSADISKVSDYDTANNTTTGENGEVHGADIPAELTPNTVLHADEDVDMDVDMEIEDGIPTNDTPMVLSAEGFTPEEPSLENKSFVSEIEFGIPPLPDEEWVPPPPPDNEPIPPPPPDEPPETSDPPPPSYVETTLPLSYTEQYNISYPGPTFEYYGQTHVEVPGSNYYAHTGQVAVPHPPLYYEALASTYPIAAPVVLNSVEPVAYYGLQDATITPQSFVNSAESSAFHTESCYQTTSSELTSVEAKSDAKCDLLLKTKETQTESLETSFIPSTVQTPSSISIAGNVPAILTASVTAVAVAPTSTSSKAQSKVMRTKKRTAAAVTTSRASKKVSSLVDKWMAVKEKMDDDEEDEPESFYDALEKKRRREIEEWRAKQIASGEAKDNANFQPLGGDWRERVKRRRAQMKSEAADVPTSTSEEGSKDGNEPQQPDLNQLSKDLPSGWQVYWDESSKQVYYGNSITSETTWIRPTS